MKKSNIYLVAAFALAVAFPALAADDGDIFEFSPVTPVVTADNPFGAAETVQFKMRLISPTYYMPEKDRVQWKICYRPDPALAKPGSQADMIIASQLYPLKLGVVVGGQTRGCEISNPTNLVSGKLTEFTLSYTTKYGDLALPMKLAADGNGTAVGDGKSTSFTPSADASYYFINNATWFIGYTTNGVDYVELKRYLRGPGFSAISPPDGERNMSYDLAYNFGGLYDSSRAYFIKTLGFDSKSVTDDTGTYWRIVNEKRTTCKPDIPTIKVDSTPENPQDQYIYVWSENDNVVTLKFSDSAAELAAAGVTQETFMDTNGVSRAFWVKKIKIDGVNSEYPFSIRGVAGANGLATTLVMSAKLGYSFDGSGDLFVDYLSEVVKCGDPLQPTITVKVNGLSSDTVSTVPKGSVATRVATLTVELSDPYTNSMDVVVKPKLAVNGVPGGDALDYFGMSFKSESLSYLEKTTNVTFEVGETQKTIYLYSWGADTNTYDIAKSVAFVPSVADPAAVTFYSGGMENALLLVQSIKPVIEEPVEDQLISVNCSVPYPLAIKVSDTYNDMKSSKGFELFLKRDISDLSYVSYGFFKPAADGYLYSVTNSDVRPLVTWENTATEKAVFYLKSPESGQISEERQISLYVKPARQVAIATTDGKEGNQYKEGDDVNVTITLENGNNDTGDTIWAFLVPQGEATNVVSATWLAKGGCSGRPIAKSGTSVNGLFTLIDGTSETSQGATYDFTVELRTKQNYSEGAPVAGFESKTMTVYSQNVIPTAEFVELNGGVETIYESGSKFETIVAKNVPTRFQVYVNDPGEYDKTTGVEGKKFETRWRIVEPGKSAVVTNLFGNPDTNQFVYVFSKPGTAVIQVDFKDKDMKNRYGNGQLNQKFEFKIEVVSNPLITIETPSGSSSFEETECADFGGEAAISVNVTMNPIDDPLKVQLTIVPNSSDNPGKFKLQEQDGICEYNGVDGDGNDMYTVYLSDGALSQAVRVKTLDGTANSKTLGFTIKSKVLNTEAYPGVPGETCATYYTGNDRTLYVLNSSPRADTVDFYPTPGSTNRVAIGTVAEDDAITWNFTDVDSDFAKGIKVTIKGGGNSFTTNIFSKADARGHWCPTFKSGDAGRVVDVKMTIIDSDEGRLDYPELVWYYQVEISKTIKLVPHGPTTGFKGANSMRYSEADGIGVGHVYANDLASVSGFVSMYNCKLDDNRTVWGYGYKAANPYDDGTLDGGNDFAINASGNALGTGDSPYQYTPKAHKRSGKPLDSFLYAWLQYSSGEGQTSGLTDGLLNNTIAPEKVEDPFDAGALVMMPSELLEGGTYADVILEAIFAYEFRPGDNMGDINQDGIPDRFIVKYGLGVYDKMTAALTGDDLANIADFNEDGDFLPAAPSATISLPGASNAWAAVSMPFNATYEIRGYHDGLNLQGISDMDLSDAERRAFKRYLKSIEADGDPAVTNAIAAFCPEVKTSDAYTNETAKLEIVFKKGIWSPENPTDPTKVDTDADELPDGYEYYFWYSAHVMGATGERYGFWTGDIAKPEKIDSKTIAALFDPNSKRNWAESPDTDGDGLEDRVEYVLGTNPVHWDSDGDGVPDGLEVMRGTDPLKADSSGQYGNPDGDYMAFRGVSDQLVVEIKVGDDIEIWGLDNKHSVDKSGNVYHKYMMVGWASAKAYDNIAYALCTKGDKGPVPQYVFLTGTNDTAAAAAELAKYADDNQILVDMPARLVFTSGEGDVTRYWIGAETVLKAGMQLTTPPADENDLSAGSTPIYTWNAFSALAGSEPRYAALVDGYHEGEVPNGLDPSAVPGLFRLYRYGDAEKGPYAIKMKCTVNRKPSATNEVSGTLTYYGGSEASTVNLSGVDGATPAAEIVRLATATIINRYHAQIYAENGFDPRTGWGNCGHGYCAARWCKTCSAEDSGDHSASTAGLSVNTAGFQTIDEYRLMHYRYQNGIRDASKDLGEVNAKQKTLLALWGEATTDPQVSYSDGGSSNTTASAVASHGADTDGDGSPDGWELYILKNPNAANDATDDEWDDLHTEDPVGDGLEHPAEFAGTDTYLAYRNVPSIGGSFESWIWFNKFFPTNPYSSDTDGDGLTDADEQAVGMDRNDYSGTQYGNSDPRVKPTSFIYGPNKDMNTSDAKWGYASDDGSICIRGGGLNPCTVDTDGDLLPDLWEWQFAGIYRQSAAAEKEPGGYIDFGMDGTDPYDSYTYRRGGLYPEDIDPRTGTLRNFDFDLDGLQNFQEYLVQALRHLRYDVETVGTRLDDGSDVSVTGVMKGIPVYYMTMFGPVDYMFGPRDVAVAIKADNVKRRGFFGTPPRDWDSMILRKEGKIRGRVMLTPGTTWTVGTTGDAFAEVQKPKGYVYARRYATTDPRMRDSDYDGMDDFYEIYHGLNPLLGERDGMRGAGSDILADAYLEFTFGPNKLPLDCFNNVFTQPNDASGMPKTYTTLDFVKHPWLAGMPLCDPDGDGLRNDQELIQVNTADPQPSNTDPTPLWMTDSSFAYSYTAQYYPLSPNIARMWALGTDSSSGAAEIESVESMFSFEMNEGYDTDNDGIPDGAELTKTVLGASDPQLFTDPTSRQALYLPGPKGGVTSLAISFEPSHLVRAKTMGNLSWADVFRQFTVECWIRPAAASLASGTKCTVLERICAYPPSTSLSSGAPTADEKHYVRANFRIGIDSGRLYGLFDNSDARSSESYLGVSSARVDSDIDLKADKWYHVAVSYDGSKFAITVHEQGDAMRSGRRTEKESHLMPANGVTEILQQVNATFPYYAYVAYDSAFIIGASATSEVGMNLQDPENPPTAADYDRHYVGYVGEVRVWDGARTAAEIAADYDRKLSYDDAMSNRAAVYDSWADGGNRSATDGTEVLPPELVQLYTFDGMHGATAPLYVAASPAAFNQNVKAPAATSLSKENGNKNVPVVIGWLSALDPSLKSVVYTDDAYVPWVKNLVARLPMLDGSVADSVYWGENLAGDHTAAEIGVTKFAFPRTANPYVMTKNYRDITLRLRRYTVLNGGREDEESSATNAANKSVFSSLSKLYRFNLRSRMASTSDLVPLGGAYIHRCTDFWDGQGAMDADVLTTDGLSDADKKGNGLPDWWEGYCRDNYMDGAGPGMALTLDTVVNYTATNGNGVVFNNLKMTAAEAYLRDLANGMLPTTAMSKDYMDVADFDYNGIPDWWENIYGLRDEGATVDSDNDGLSNIIEYMLSEMFDLRDAGNRHKVFSPVDARSNGSVNPDYFFPVGSLYVGEIFADHDMIEDWWEYGYDADYVSALEYDAAGDNDDDGWSAWSEARYSQQVSPIVANNQFHYSVTDGFVPDYPIPTVQLKVHYNGSRLSEVRNSSIGVKIGRSLDPNKSFDAEYYVAGLSKTAASGSSGAGNANSSTNGYKHVIGKWSDRHVYGTLTPGFVNSSTLAIQTAFDPSSVTYSWMINEHGSEGIGATTIYRRGTRAELEADRRTYGQANVVVLSSNDSYSNISGLEVRTDLNSDVATVNIAFSRGGASSTKTLGTVNLKTGEYDFDLGIFKNVIRISSTNSSDMAAFEDLTYRIVYSANESVGIPRDLYLGEADNGRIYEGSNNIVVWADLDGNGNYDVGEPFGFVQGVDISWRRRAVEVELFDTSPTMPRIDLVNATSDRGKTVVEYYTELSNRIVNASVGLSPSAIADDLARLSWINEDAYESVSLSADTLLPVRVRVVRWLVDGYPVYQVETPATVVFDKYFNLSEHQTLTEADILADGDFDLDWKYLNSEVVNGYGPMLVQLPVNSVAYLVVVGEGATSWDSNGTLNIVNQVIERNYDATQAVAEVWSPKNAQSVVYAARPTFTWTIPSAGVQASYTAFRIQIQSEDGSTDVWDSGTVALPPRDSNGRYVWTAPVYIGEELQPSVNYRWRVSALNAKFPEPTEKSWSKPGVFRMEPDVAGSNLGRIDVCAKYFGPTNVLANGRVVVEAFESPDFTGDPASRVIITNKSVVASSDTNNFCLASLRGLKRGSYYIRAYIDSSSFGTQNVRDSWESWGYLSDRSGAKREIFEPVAMVIDGAIGAGDVAVVYIEDADTNGNRLPDAWEMLMSPVGSLDNGTTNLNETLKCGLSINKALSGGIKDATGVEAVVAHLASSFKTRGLASLALGVSPDSISVNQSGQIELENKVDSVEIEELSFVDGKLTIAVSGKVAPAVESAGAGLYDVSYSSVKTVSCEIYRRASLAAEDGWELAVPARDITVGSGAVEIEVSQGEGPSGFYKVVVK